MAAYFGEGVSHFSIENRIRLHRKEGEKLRDEAEAGGSARAPATPARRSAPQTPRSNRQPRGGKTGSGTSAFSKRARGKVMQESGSGDGSGTEEDNDTPSKKPKVEKRESSDGVEAREGGLLPGPSAPDDQDSVIELDSCPPELAARGDLGVKKENGPVDLTGIQTYSD